MFLIGLARLLGVPPLVDPNIEFDAVRKSSLYLFCWHLSQKPAFGDCLGVLG